MRLKACPVVLWVALVLLRSALGALDDFYVFNESQVALIKVTISPENYRTMLQSRNQLGPEAIHEWVPCDGEFQWAGSQQCCYAH